MQGSAHAPGAHDRALFGEGALDVGHDQAGAPGANRQRSRGGILRLDADQAPDDPGDASCRPAPRRGQLLRPEAKQANLVAGQCEGHRENLTGLQDLSGFSSERPEFA